MRFDRPATRFTESCPLGNGRLGAMVFGNPDRERIVLNELSMWSGGVQDPNRHDAYQYLKPIQQLLLEGKNIEAQKLLQSHFICAGPGSGNGNGKDIKYGCYQTLGDLWIRWADTTSSYTGYTRSLRLDSAVSTTDWVRHGVAYRQQVIVSAPDQAILVRLTASRPGALHFVVGLSRQERVELSVTGHRIRMSGMLNGGNGDEGIRYAAMLDAVPAGGRFSATGDGLEISGASSCLLVITAGTDMNWPQVEQRGPDPAPRVLRQALSAAAKPWASLLRQHVADYQSYFDRCRFWLGDPASATAPGAAPATVPARLDAVQHGQVDPSLVPLYYNFGRYLLISSSRPGGMPANLQGLWAEEYETPWNGDYHTDINVQMNYWQTGAGGLPDCELPVFTLLQEMARYGKQTAKAYYQSDGWVAHVITNPWGFTAPGEGAEWGSTLTCGAWLATHIWMHYQFYPDRAFLARYYPVLKGASQFFTHILIEEPQHHWLVTAPSNSPENAFLMPDGRPASTCMGPTIDMQIGRQLLLGTAEAARILGIDSLWADSLRHTAMALAPDQISPSTGAVQEWLQDYKEQDPHHRHVSPMYGLYPSDEITPWGSPALAAAARTTLERRGDDGTGWSRAWKIAFWARLGNGDHAYKMLRALWKPADDANQTGDYAGAGTYPNLFDACPPFQIDGNFGAAAALLEFFVQSQGEGHIIRLLPALPSDPLFQTGRFSGIRARGGFSVDGTWTHGRPHCIVIHSLFGQPCAVAIPGAGSGSGVGSGSTTGSVSIRDASGHKVRYTVKDGVIRFKTTRGGAYTIASAD
jgi:alpha-L-fucosidase 2